MLIGIPFLALLGNEEIMDMLAERFTHKLAVLEQVDGLAQRCRQHGNAARQQLLTRELPQAGLLGRRLEGKLVLDALQPRCKQDGECQIRIRSGIGTVQLEAACDGTVRTIPRNADERIAIAHRPCDADGRIAIRHQYSGA